LLVVIRGLHSDPESEKDHSKWVAAGLEFQLAKDPMHPAADCHFVPPYHLGHSQVDQDQKNQKELQLPCPHQPGLGLQLGVPAADPGAWSGTARRRIVKRPEGWIGC